MNTVCLLGSPRVDGNSDVLAQRFLNAALEMGAVTQQHRLSELDYRGCVNLMACKTGQTRCAQNDDLTPVLDAVSQAQVLVLATPVYFTNISGQLKLAIDRFFSFFVPDYPTAAIKSRLSPGRHVVLLQTQGEPEERYADLIDQYAVSFKGLGFDNAHLVRACGVREPGDVLSQQDVLAQCDALAKKIYGDARV